LKKERSFPAEKKKVHFRLKKERPLLAEKSKTYNLLIKVSLQMYGFKWIFKLVPVVSLEPNANKHT
jgi:hypothetical protein